jgi:HD-GYP domain-containing protein (c-di-GMP phosphodiesterase class II)
VSTKSFAERLGATLTTNQDQPPHRALEALIDAVDSNDTYRRGHSRRVAAYATGLARVMGSSASEIALVHLGGLVHDVGKIGIPDWVLQKPGSLTPAELHLLQLHPIIGASIISRMPDMKSVVPIVLHHHEWWDGTGYPSGLKGVEIPVQARMICVVEAFDAITSEGDPTQLIEREIDKALEALRKGAGKQFDPLTVEGMHEAWRNGMFDEPLRSSPPEETVRL